MGLGIICAGQGLQTREMFAMLSSLPELSEAFLILKKSFSFDVFPQVELDDKSLFDNHYAQPLIAAQTFMQWQTIKDSIPEPIAFTGYSLGELTAYACNGAFALDQLINLAKLRAKAMDESTRDIQSSMLGVTGIGFDEIKTLCKKTACYVSIQNSIDHFVVGGMCSSLACFEALLQEEFPYVKRTNLNVSIASHTPLLSEASASFKPILMSEKWHAFGAPVVAGINGQAVYNKENACMTLSRQLSETIHFNQAIKVMYELGADVILEIGPGNALSRIASSLHLPIKARAFSDFASIKGIIDWINVHLGHNQ